jgi:hypothetical protein
VQGSRRARNGRSRAEIRFLEQINRVRKRGLAGSLDLLERQRPYRLKEPFLPRPLVPP